MSQHDVKETLELDAHGQLCQLPAPPPPPSPVEFFYTHPPVGGAGVLYYGHNDWMFFIAE